jgi:hypothetical protein
MALFRVSSGFDPVSGLLGLQREKKEEAKPRQIAIKAA